VRLFLFGLPVKVREKVVRMANVDLSDGESMDFQKVLEKTMSYIAT
jgi:hypothetical protein